MTNPNLRDREIYNREVRRESQVVRENDSAASGMLLGIVLTALIGLVAGAFYFANQKPAAQTPSNKTTIIEKTRETVKPQPAPDVNVTVPNPPPVQVPDVNVNVSPNPAPGASTNSTQQQAPATTGTDPTQPASQP